MVFEFGSTTVAINVPTSDALLTEVGDRLTNGQGFALATLNADHLVKLRRHSQFREAYAAQDLVTADGNPIVWLSKLAGKPVQLVAGSDMAEPLARKAAEVGAKIALVGATPDALAGCTTTLQQRIPGVEVVCSISPPMGFDPQGADAKDILAQVRDSGAGLCLIALGAPKQELFAALGRTIAPGVGFASVGASIDFLAGTQTRAPRWVRRIALEWMWRLGTDPARLARRYLDCAMILPEEAISAIRQRGT